MNRVNDAISDSSNQDGEEERQSQRRNMLPVNVWGENWRLKLRAMMEDQDKNESEIANTSSPRGWGGADKSGTNEVEHVPNAKPKKTMVSRSSTIGKEKYGQRLHGFLNNPLVRALRAPEVWEDAVKIWTNNYGKQRFCVVMVSNYILLSYCIVNVIVIVIVIDII
jgi:hypothetical protein